MTADFKCGTSLLALRYAVVHLTLTVLWLILLLCLGLTGRPKSIVNRLKKWGGAGPLERWKG